MQRRARLRALVVDDDTAECADTLAVLAAAGFVAFGRELVAPGLIALSWGR